MNKPDKSFFIVGAQRSGTTLLVKLLSQQRRISMASPLKPEPKFFLRDDWANTSRETYLNQYHGQRWKHDGVICGEKSTSYYESAEVPARIKAYFPDARILFILRSPVHRALSNYKFSLSNKLESRPPEEVFRGNAMYNIPPNPFGTSVNPFDYLYRGHYADFVSRYQDTFGAENVHILFFEELITQPLTTMNDIHHFLGLPLDQKVFKIETKVNATEMSVDVADGTLKRIAQYFQPHIKKLENILNRPVPQAWLTQF